MTMRATDIFKAIQKLNPAEKHRLREYLIDALTASSSTGTVLEEISERKNKNIKIQQIVGFINKAMDWEEEVLQREKSSVIVFGDMDIKILYENEKEIYFQSEKGTKLMKPEPDFFKLTNLSQ